METERIGGWILTHAGRRFFPLDPRAEDVDIHDIACALSNLCRFNGHCNRFYSVAEHSLLVTANVPAKYKPWALLHDAAEAYLADVTRPVKHSEGMEAYRRAEDAVLASIFGHFELAQWMPPLVKDVDNRVLMTERRDLMPVSEHRWAEELEAIDPFPAVIPAYAQNDIREQFLRVALSLGLE